MKLSDMDFFHQASKKICGSLDVQTVLARCLDFFSDFLPLDGIAMKIYDHETRSVVSIATVGAAWMKPLEAPIPLPDEAAQVIEEEEWEPVSIINHPEKDVLARVVWKAMGRKRMSCLVLNIKIDEDELGVVAFMTKGYDRYTPEHARLLKLVHDPFAMAMANTLKHQELIRLKDLLADDNRYLDQQLHRMSGDKIIGSEFGLKYVMDMVRQIAPRKSQVLLLGETGVGKEVVANAIHYSSPRAGKPFIKVNCGAIPENLIDSELFGHEKGAFTGALSRKRGRFERADKGTLFLDEIGELPPHAQVRLLRVLQSREIERVGGTRPIPVDIRIIAATHRDLPEMVARGEFREDLWFRLNVFPITIPPLRERKSDIPALTRYFMEKKAREMNFQEQPVLAPGALEKLQSYTWPGNVRELENLVERTIIQGMAGIQGVTGTPGRSLEFETLLPGPARERGHAGPETAEGPLLLDDVVRHHIRKVLRMVGGRVQGEKGAAALLGINPSTLRNRMKKLGIPYGRKNK